MATMRILTNMNFHRRDSLLIGQTITLLYIIIIIVPALIITLQGQNCNAQSCNSVNHTKGSEFESNLNTVLNSLVKNTCQTGFNTSVYGQSPDQIYGLLQCRSDATVDECHNYSRKAVARIRESCGNSIGGSFWGDCFLRFENNSFIGKMEMDGSYTYIANSNISNPDVFTAAVEKLLYKLTGEVKSGSAYGTAVDSQFRRIYAKVYCTRDISADDCTTCLSNTINSILVMFPGNTGVQGLMQSCFIRYEIYSFFKWTELSPPPAEPPKQITPSSDNSTQINHSHRKPSNKIPIILGAVGGLLLLLFVCVLATWRRLKSSIFRTGYEGDGEAEEDTLINDDGQIVFTMETLVAATENFHDDNKLGEGGFGAVYKGRTSDGKEIAVKKLSLKSLQGKKEFMNEVQLVAKIQHRNLVNLLGCCVEGSERLLVYEYLPNKSLDKILFDPNKRNQLDWHNRYNIIMGVARGLLYLHQDSQLRIIHRDIKASNILLDEKLNPKIADFGLARLFSEDESHVSTKVAGTYGYMAPEYALQGQLSIKVDVYSFGVVLLELITGRKNTDYNLSSDMQMLLGWAWRSYKRGNHLQMIDPSIIETCDEEQALRFIHVGLLCTQADSSLRPSMSTVTLMLSSPSVTLPNPTKPAFVRSHVSQSTTTSSGSGLSHASAITSSSVASHSPDLVAPPSNADASITVLVPR